MARKKKHYKGYQHHLEFVVARCERECDHWRRRLLDEPVWEGKRFRSLLRMYYGCQRQCQGAKVGRRWRRAAGQALHMPEWSSR